MANNKKGTRLDPMPSSRWYISNICDCIPNSIATSLEYKWKLYVLREFFYQIVVQDMVLWVWKSICVRDMGYGRCSMERACDRPTDWTALFLSFSLSLPRYHHMPLNGFQAFGTSNKSNITANKWNKFPPQTAN